MSSLSSTPHQHDYLPVQHYVQRLHPIFQRLDDQHHCRLHGRWHSRYSQNMRETSIWHPPSTQTLAPPRSNIGWPQVLNCYRLDSARRLLGNCENICPQHPPAYHIIVLTPKGYFSNRNHRCSHCWGEMVTEDPTWTHIACMNSWHKNCLQEWIQSRDTGRETCPICCGAFSSMAVVVRPDGESGHTWQPSILNLLAQRFWMLSLGWLGIFFTLLATPGDCLTPSPSIKGVLFAIAFHKVNVWVYATVYLEGHRAVVLCPWSVPHWLRHLLLLVPALGVSAVYRCSYYSWTMITMFNAHGFAHSATLMMLEKVMVPNRERLPWIH